jgi:hypothetical protein
MRLFRWENGRQAGDYAKLPLAIASWPMLWDIYILKYPEGSFIAPHADPVTDRNHYRLNIVLKKPKAGGVFHCDRTIFETDRIKLFRSDANVHSLSMVERGSRYVLSIGWAPKRKQEIS